MRASWVAAGALLVCVASSACDSADSASGGSGGAWSDAAVGFGGVGGGNGYGNFGGVGGGGGVGGAAGYSGSQASADAGEQASIDGGVRDGDAGFLAIPEEIANPFVSAAHDPFSTFAADVDTASYDTFLQQLSYGALPPPSTVRIEDFVNYFDYAYDAPNIGDEHPFAITLAAAPHPTGRGTELLRVGIQAAKRERGDEPANLVFLVDTSGSMSSPDKLPLVKVLLRAALDVLAPTDTLSIVTYAGTTRVALAPTPIMQRATITSVIDSFETGGGTNGSGGIQLAYEQAQAGRIEGGINHVILCTDGDFNIGISDPSALNTFISDKRETGITLTAVGFGQSRSGDATMETLSNNGDGIYSVVYSEDRAIEYANERMLSTLVRVAKDMKIQVEMNPELVSAYRLIGYENRAIADHDFRNDVIDAGDIGAGHRVTALYEIVRTGVDVPMPQGAPALQSGPPVDGTREIGVGELVRVKVRYKQPGAGASDPAFEVTQALLPNAVLTSADDANDDFRWAAAVATLAEILRGSPFASQTELSAIDAEISAQASRDSDRQQLATLISTVRKLLAP